MRPERRHIVVTGTVAAALVLWSAATGIPLPGSAPPLQAAGPPLSSSLTTAPMRARVLDAFGQVQQRASGAASSAPWKTVSLGDALPERTVLRTGDDSAALLLLPGGHRVRVGANTTVVLKDLGKQNSYSFDVLAGQIWSLVRKANHPARYEVETPSAVAGVTGTLFGVSYDSAGEETLVSTDEGSVRVRQGNQVTPVLGGRMGRFRVMRPRMGKRVAPPRPLPAPPPPPAQAEAGPAVASGRAAPVDRQTLVLPGNPPVRFLSPVVSQQNASVRRMWRLLHAEGDWAEQRDAAALRRARLNRGRERELIRELRQVGWGGSTGAGWLRPIRSR